MNKTRLIERIAELVNEKRIERHQRFARQNPTAMGCASVVELKRDAEPKTVLNQLYKLSQMQQSYGLVMLSIHEGRPRELSLLEETRGLPAKLTGAS